MGKYRFSKLSNPVLPPKEVETKLKIDPCLVCLKEIQDGYYGRFDKGGVCSKACHIVFEFRRGDTA